MRRTDARPEAQAEEAGVEAWKRQWLRASCAVWGRSQRGGHGGEVTAGRSWQGGHGSRRPPVVCLPDGFHLSRAALAEIKTQLPPCDRSEIPNSVAKVELGSSGEHRPSGLGE